MKLTMFDPRSIASLIAQAVAPFPATGRRRGRRRFTPARALVLLERLEKRCLLSITEFPVPDPYPGRTSLYGITAGPDGNIWLTVASYGGSYIGSINPTTHDITEFAGTIDPRDITVGPDGNLWFSDRGANSIGMFNLTTHAITEFPVPTPNASLEYGIATGSDGNLWFTEYNANKVGMINPTTDAVTEFTPPNTNPWPEDITAGPDGNIWFTEQNASKIGVINPTTDAISEFATPTPGAHPSGITLGPDGNLWFAEGGAPWMSKVNQIGMINPTTHVITEYPTPTPNSGPISIAAGSDGNLWFSEYSVGQIGKIDPTTDTITEYPIPYANSVPWQITAGPDGNIWFADLGTTAIGVVTVNGTQLVVKQQPASSVTAGTAFGLTVEAEDSSGNLDASFNGTVTVALANNPGGAALGGTLSVTASGGIATFSDLTLDTAAQGYTLQVSATGVASATTSAVTVNPAPPSQLVITQQPPTSVTAGTAFSVQATIEDQYRNVEMGDNATLTVGLGNNPGGATLGGTLTEAASQGVANFDGLNLSAAGVGYTLLVSTSGLPSATTDPITVPTVQASRLVVIQEPPASISAGNSFELSVAAEDSYGDLAPTFNGTVSVALGTCPVGASLGGTVTGTAVNGIAGFSGLTLMTAFSGYTLLASANGLDGAVTSATTVTPAPASQLVITQPPPPSVQVNKAFGLQATIEDPYGNVETGDNSNVMVAIANNPGAATLRGELSIAASQGVATFSGLTLDSIASGYTLAVSTGDLTGATTNPINVTPVPATTIVIIQPPAASIDAGTPFGLIVQVQDETGDLAFTFDGTITVALANNPTGATLGGMLNVAATNGVATFAGLMLTKAGSGYAIQISGNGLTSAATGAMTVNPAPASQVAFTQEPQSSVIAGSPFGLQATIEDAYGNIETGDSDTVSLALAGGPTGASLGGATSVAASAGVASFAGLVLTEAGAGYAIQISSGAVSGTTTPITVVPAPAAKLVIAQQPPLTAPAGPNFGLTIDVEDVYGNLAAFSGTVTIAIATGPPGSTLTGTTTETASAGVATFTGLALTQVGSYTLDASSGGLNGTTTSSIAVTPAAPSQLVVTAEPPATVDAGDGFGLTVVAEDQYGNATPVFSGTVAVSINSGPENSSIGGTTSVTAAGGVASLWGLVLDTAGPYQLLLSSAGLASATTSGITVSPITATSLAVIGEPPGSVTAGVPFGLAVEAKDPFGNLATGFGGTLTVALMGGPGIGTFGGPVTFTANQGVASLSGLTVNRASGDDTLQVLSAGLTAATTSVFAVAPGAASQLVFSTQPPASVTAGNPFGVTVTAEDAYGNVATTFNGPVAIGLANNGVGVALGGQLETTASAGMAAFPGLSLDQTGSPYTIGATSGSLTGATSLPVVVTPAAAFQLAVSIPPPTVVSAGAEFGLAIVALDEYGNVATGYGGDVTIGLANHPAGATLEGPLSVTASDGVASFEAFLSLDQAGSGYSLVAAGSGLASVTTGTLTVNPLPATRLVVLRQPPSLLFTGSKFGFAVAADDAFGNIDPGFDGQVTVAASGKGSGVGGTTTVTAKQGVASFGNLSLTNPTSTVSLAVTTAGLTGTATNAVSVTAPAQLAFASDRVTVNENAGAADIEVSRVSGDQGPVSVEVATTRGTAVAGVNYTATNQVLNFAAGQDSATVRIPIKDDGVATPDLTVGLVLTNPAAAAVLGSLSAATLVIHNVDQPVAPPLVTVTGVNLVQDNRGRVTEILVGFSGPLDAREADRLGTYRLTAPDKSGSYTANDAHVIRIRSAVYNGANDTVALTPRTPFGITRPVQLVVYGTGPTALEDAYGRRIDGEHNGTAGGNATAHLIAAGATTKTRALGPSGGPWASMAAIDAVIEHDPLRAGRRRSATHA
jgi:streptogramin lyase